MKRHEVEMFRRFRQPIGYFLLYSLLCHVLVGVIVLLSPPVPKLTPAQHNQVEVEIREAQDSLRDTKAQQIVEQKDQQNDEIDPQAKYLSAFNQKVKKQTQALTKGQFQNQPAQSQAQLQAPSLSQEETRQQEDLQTPALHQISKKTRPDFASLKPQFQPSPHVDQLQVTPGSGNANSPPAATDDYLKGVETGMQTMLSTREFVYYSYYNRIKEKIRQHWESSIREKVKLVFRQGRSLASSKDHITQVVIVLNKAGELVRVEVITPSGIEDLDQAAVEAFRSAEPFPNPPQGLVEKDGMIRIRWDFVLEANNFHLPWHHQDTQAYNTTPYGLMSQKDVSCM